MIYRNRRPSSELWAITLGFPLVLIILWEIAARSHVFPSYMVAPSIILREALSLVTNGKIFAQMGASLYRAYAGFIIGSAVGVSLGLLSGVSRPVQDLFDTVQGFVHAIPKISLFPAIAIWLGFSDASRIIIIALSCFFPAYLNAMNGALGINPSYIWLSKNNEISRLRCFLQVIIPASLPRVFVGLRISLMVAFILMVATEVIGHSNGLGSLAMSSYEDGQYAEMYATILFIAVTGYFSNLALQRIASALCRGQQLNQEEHRK